MQRTSVKYIVASLMLLILATADLLTGTVRTLDPDIVINLRLPRMLTACFAGAALSLAGLQMQSIFRNPLSDPYIMGISSGSGLFVAMALMIGGRSLPGMGLVGSAFAGALAVSFTVLGISGKVRGTTTLLLFGVMLGMVVSAVTQLLASMAPEGQLKMYYSWASGSFQATDLRNVAVLGMSLAVGLIMALWNRRGLDVTLFGDDFTILSGLSPKVIRFVALVSACVLAAAVTAFCGPVGFVGIVAPHISRRLLGKSRHALLIPMSLIMGASFAILADILSQCTGHALPVGSVMAVTGIPVIIYIIWKDNAVRS